MATGYFFYNSRPDKPTPISQAETVKKAERTIQNFSKHFSDNPNLTPNHISPEKAESFPYKITTIQDNPLTVHLFTYNLTEFFRQIVSNNPNVTPQMANKITQTAIRKCYRVEVGIL